MNIQEWGKEYCGTREEFEMEIFKTAVICALMRIEEAQQAGSQIDRLTYTIEDKHGMSCGVLTVKQEIIQEPNQEKH